MFLCPSLPHYGRVPFSLTPVSAFPELPGLLEEAGDLENGIQGKSCFDVMTIDNGQHARLSEANGLP